MTRPRWLPGVVLGSTVLLLVVAAVWAWTLIQEERATSAPDASLADQCDRVPADAERVTLEADDGFTLGAATVGRSGAKIGLVVALLVTTAPVFVYDLRQARGSREDRIELLSLMERILGPAIIGESRAEQTPYRDGHPVLGAGGGGE